VGLAIPVEKRGFKNMPIDRLTSRLDLKMIRTVKANIHLTNLIIRDAPRISPQLPHACV
jgi:hypothetical protein